MSAARKLACVVVLAVCAASLAAPWLASAGYAKQFREAPGSPPSRQHLLGTDELGRDRFARVLYGTRISLLLAPAAALISTLLAAFVGGLAGYVGGIWLRWRLADGSVSFPAMAVSVDHGAGGVAAERFSAASRS